MLADTNIQNFLEQYKETLVDDLIVTNKDIIEGFKIDCKRRGFSERTTHNHVQISKIYLGLVGESYFDCYKTYRDYRPSMVLLKDYCDYKKHSHSTKELYFSAISALFSYLIEIGRTNTNPTLEFRKRHLTPYKKQREERQLVSKEDIENIIRNAKYPYNIFALVLAKTGMRRSEFCRLKARDFNFEKMMIVISENESNRKRSNTRIPVDEQTKEWILKYWETRKKDTGVIVSGDCPAFVGKQGRRLDGEVLRLNIKKAAIKIGLHDSDGPLCERFSPHCFRHWMTTELVDSGIDGTYVDEIRGDSRDRARDRYHKISDKKLVEVYQRHMPQLDVAFKL